MFDARRILWKEKDGSEVTVEKDEKPGHQVIAIAVKFKSPIPQTQEQCSISIFLLSASLSYCSLMLQRLVSSLPSISHLTLQDSTVESYFSRAKLSSHSSVSVVPHLQWAQAPPTVPSERTRIFLIITLRLELGLLHQASHGRWGNLGVIQNKSNTIRCSNIENKSKRSKMIY